MAFYVSGFRRAVSYNQLAPMSGSVLKADTYSAVQEISAGMEPNPDVSVFTARNRILF
jgi:hypothetical protein